jgi:mannose-6-phosphate isomerase-like protein (cupin superfamily)
MKKSLVAITALLMSSSAALAQAPAAEPTPRAPPSNPATGVVIDQYIAYPERVVPHVTHDTMIERTLLSAGDPNGASGPRKVLSYHSKVALWELEGMNETSLFTLSDLVVLYVQSGVGTLDDGKQVWDLKPGMAALIPAGLAHRFTNTGDKPLKMMTGQQTPNGTFTPRRDILVRDVNKLAITERGSHWSNQAKYVFLGKDGLHETDKLFIVYLPAWTIAGPHAHTPGQQEFWFKVSDGPALMQLGSEIRPWPLNAGFMVPPNGKTVHGHINTGDEMQAWFYMSRLSERAPPPPATPRPEAAAIAAAVERATVAGRPLAPQRGR